MAAIVLLPGMDGTGSLFSDFIASLPQGIKTLVVSYPEDRPLGYSELEALASKKLPSDSFILLGESFSGPVAVALAASAPPGLRGLVLVNSFVRKPMPVPAFAARFAFWRLPVRLAAVVLLGRWSSKEQRDRLSVATSKVRPEVWRARLRTVLDVDVANRLRSVTVPVLYLRGSSDRVVPRSAWNRVKDALPSARLVELDGPHFLLQARAEEAAAKVMAFARGVGLTG